MKKFSFSAWTMAMFFAGIFFVYGCGGDGGGASADAPADAPPPANDPAPAPVVVLYVDAAAVGAGDGSSWADAHPTLQGGVDAALSGEEVWVRQGTYRAASANASVLVMKDGVAVYGGFAGTETTRGERSTDPALTILSGDFDLSGTFSATDSFHVVVGASNARLDGFTVTAGNATGANPNNFGGGMFNDNASSPEVVNVTFSANAAVDGGGMLNNFSSPVLSNVTFSANSAIFGGGMFNQTNSSPALRNVTFSDNSAGSGGGGMLNQINSSPALRNVTFSTNSAASDGGGMTNTRQCLKTRWPNSAVSLPN